MINKRKMKIGLDSSGLTENCNDSACDETKQENIDLSIIQKILDEHSAQSSSNGSGKDDDKALILILQEVQEAYGYIPRPVIYAINKRTGYATSKIFGIVTFYDQFSTEKRGKYVIKTCSGTACQVRGGKKSLQTIKKKLGIDVGETTEDYKFTLETAGCLGACAISPAMFVNKELFGRVTQEKIDPILDQFS